MDVLEITGVRIGGIVACLPENIIDNRKACEDLFPGNTVDTMIKATGINKRYIADIGTSALDLDVIAASNLFENTNTTPDEIGAVICVTFTPEYLMPSDAPSAQSRLGIPNHSLAFDINMACSGYGYGLYIASTLVKALNKKVLLLDGDIQSAYVSKTDKATVPVMSDAGTATLLEPCTNNTWKFSFYTDGSRRDKLFIPAGGSKHPMQYDDLSYKVYDDGSKRRNADIYMDGFEIFKFVAKDASKFISSFMEELELSPEKIDVFVPHQANMYMIEQLGKKLKFKQEQIWKSGDEFGNPGSSSVPLTIAQNMSKHSSDFEVENLLFSGFGGGLSISVAKINLNNNGYYNVIQKKKGE
jgi:3-oxoacyl-[acyl-carrier-protein] synthase-3